MEFSVKGRRRRSCVRIGRTDRGALRVEQQPYANPVGTDDLPENLLYPHEAGSGTQAFNRGERAWTFSRGGERGHQRSGPITLGDRAAARQMTALRVGPEYAKARVALTEELNPSNARIDKTVDCSADQKHHQAEEVAHGDFCRQNPQPTKPRISAADFDYILELGKNSSTAFESGGLELKRRPCAYAKLRSCLKQSAHRPGFGEVLYGSWRGAKITVATSSA